MQVGEQGQVGAQQRKLFGLGLFDLDDEPCPLPHLDRVFDDRGAGGAVGVVGDARTEPCTSLHEHRHVVGLQLADAVRRDGHPQLVVLDLGGHAHGQRW